ncbi:hypothetical protein OUZ56_005510 [Daphnia magna]|uniref:Uncharacterized protein n=1 Tax=Daphnia magna TaxID=35525 RepID=A0ABQ9YT07_9CRUS|nr:hypothetical protein OUZ56_005510 [Daphnia magna]
MSLHRVSSQSWAPLEEFPGFPRGLQTLLQFLCDFSHSFKFPFSVLAAFSIHDENYTVGYRKYRDPTGLKTGKQPATEQSVGNYKKRSKLSYSVPTFGDLSPFW